MSVAAAERYNTISGAGRLWYKTWPGKSGSWQGDAPIPVLEGRPRNNNTLDGRRPRRTAHVEHHELRMWPKALRVKLLQQPQVAVVARRPLVREPAIGIIRRTRQAPPPPTHVRRAGARVHARPVPLLRRLDVEEHDVRVLDMGHARRVRLQRLIHGVRPLRLAAAPSLRNVRAPPAHGGQVEPWWCFAECLDHFRSANLGPDRPVGPLRSFTFPLALPVVAVALGHNTDCFAVAAPRERRAQRLPGRECETQNRLARCVPRLHNRMFNSLAFRQIQCQDPRLDGLAHVAAKGSDPRD